MKRYVNGDETDLEADSARVDALNDRLIVHSSEGTFSAVVLRQGEAILISYRGRQYRVEERPSRSAVASHGGSGELRAPMPGQIVDVRRAVGDLVRKADTILVLEAMKTQQPFQAPFDGKIVELPVKTGDQVSDGALLAKVEATEP